MSAVRSPGDVGIILTYRCHSGCKHCLYNSGPGWGMEAISRETLRHALETLASWEPPPQVHLTGGEPFIFFDLLLEGTRLAAGLGITVYAETGASWCTDDGAARDRFAALQEAGMAAVLISCSPFHAEKIPPVRTVRVAPSHRVAFPGRRSFLAAAFRLSKRAAHESQNVPTLLRVSGMLDSHNRNVSTQRPERSAETGG